MSESDKSKVSESDKAKENLWHRLIKNPLQKIIFFIIGVIFSFFLSKGVEVLTVKFFPEYFTNDAVEILISQDKHFNELNKALSGLKEKISSPEAKNILTHMETSVNDAKKDNSNLILALESVKNENSILRKQLKGGDSAGIDSLKLYKDKRIKYKDTSFTIIGADSDSMDVRYSNFNKNSNFHIYMSQSKIFSFNDDETCSMYYLRYNENGVADVEIECKPKK